MNKQKKLIIVRHGKSDWSHEDRADIDRPLKDRGVRDAYTMSQRLLQQNLRSDRVITSPANRAMHTAIIFCREMEIPLEKLSIDEAYYISYEEKVLENIQETDDAVNTLMIFGHNPTFTNLANLFVPDPISNIPTAGVVAITFKADAWKKISGGTLDSWLFDYPKKEKS